MLCFAPCLLPASGWVSLDGAEAGAGIEHFDIESCARMAAGKPLKGWRAFPLPLTSLDGLALPDVSTAPGPAPSAAAAAASFVAVAPNQAALAKVHGVPLPPPFCNTFGTLPVLQLSSASYTALFWTMSFCSSSTWRLSVKAGRWEGTLPGLALNFLARRLAEMTNKEIWRGDKRGLTRRV